MCSQCIFDLWHGTILSEDGALQLCLIVDYICDWARKNYREEILACLAAGSGLLRRFTSPMPSQSGDGEANSQWELESLLSRHSVDPVFQDRTDHAVAADNLADTMDNSDALVDVEAHRQHGADQEDVYHWSRWISNDQNSAPWTSFATIRHTNLVQLIWQELTLPEDAKSLRTCLEICFPRSDYKDAANRLLTTLLCDGICITAGSNIVLRRKTPLSGNIPRTRTFIYFRTQLRPEDWQIERYVLYISCTEMAMQTLGRLAGQVLGDIEAPGTWDLHDCECLFGEMDRFRLINGEEAGMVAMAALPDRQKCVKLCQDTNGQEHFKIVKFCAQESGRLRLEDLKALREAIAGRNDLDAYGTEHRTCFQVPSRTERPDLANASRNGASWDESPGMLVRKPPSWPRETPEFCFFATDEDVDFRDVARLASMIQRVQDEDRVFGVRGQLEGSDKLLLNRWIHGLREELPETTAFR